MEKILKEIKQDLKELDGDMRILYSKSVKLLLGKIISFEEFCKGDNNKECTLGEIFNMIYIRYSYCWIILEEIERNINISEKDSSKINSLSEFFKEVDDMFPRIFKIIDNLRKHNEVRARFNDYLKLFIYVKEADRKLLTKYRNVAKISANVIKELYEAEYDFELGTFFENFKFSYDFMACINKYDLENVIFKTSKKIIIAYQEYESKLIYILLRAKDKKLSFEVVIIDKFQREVKKFEDIYDILKYLNDLNLEVLIKSTLKLEQIIV